MIQWEYYRERFSASGIDQELDRLGAEGWELVGITAEDAQSALYVFKRPLPDPFEALEPVALALVLTTDGEVLAQPRAIRYGYRLPTADIGEGESPLRAAMRAASKALVRPTKARLLRVYDAGDGRALHVVQVGIAGPLRPLVNVSPSFQPERSLQFGDLLDGVDKALLCDTAWLHDRTTAT